MLGKRKYTRKTYPDVRSANQAKRRILDERDAGTLAHDEGMTLQSLCDRVLSLPTDRAPSTVRSYRNTLERVVYPKLGATRLNRITGWVLQSHIDALRAAGSSPNELRNAVTALSVCLKHAAAWGLIPTNPATGLILPRYRPENPATAISLAEARKLLVAADKDEEAGGLIAVLLLTGLRIGEALALGWGAVDLDEGVLHVRRHLQRQEDDTWMVVPGAKSKSGQRTVKLSAEAVAVLKRQRARQNGWRLALGTDWVATDLVFTLRDGRTIRVDLADYRLKKACKAAGIEPMSPHDLRSTHATLLAEAAERSDLLALQQRLGHSDLGQSMAYVTPDHSGQGKLADRLDERLRGEAVGE